MLYQSIFYNFLPIDNHHDQDGNIAKLVVKPANESGGYGIMVGPHSSAATHRKFAQLIEKDPRNYIAQPTLSGLCSAMHWRSAICMHRSA